MVPMASIFGQIIWWNGCVCWTSRGDVITSIGSIGYWEPNLCEGLCSKLHSCSNWIKSWLHSNSDYYGWIQNRNRFKCIITNNRWWSRRHNGSRNIIIGCHKLPSLSCRGYLISMLNMFVQCFTHLVVHLTSVVGMTIGVSKSTSWRYLWFPSFLLLYWYLMKRYVYYNRLLKLIARSFNQLYSLCLKMWLFLWLNHFTNKLLQCF
jgi:hypothetical protein